MHEFVDAFLTKYGAAIYGQFLPFKGFSTAQRQYTKSRFSLIKTL